MTDLDTWFNALADARALSEGERRELTENGFVVVSGPVPSDGLARLSEAYDSAVASADPADVKNGSTTTRVTDFVNRGPLFDDLYVYPRALDAWCEVIRQPFRLSTMHARTVRPHAAAQDLHVDFERAADGWPMLGFIFMVDEFRPDNGATRFVPGSHEPATRPDDEAPAELACGPAGSMILFNGSVWHGHSAHVRTAATFHTGRLHPSRGAVRIESSRAHVAGHPGAHRAACQVPAGRLTPQCTLSGHFNCSLIRRNRRKRAGV